MSVKAMAWAWAVEADLKPSERLTLLAIADRADDDGRCWPGQTTLATKCNTTDRTIRRHLTTLQEAGLMERVARTRENGSRTSDYLILNLDRPEKMSAPNRTRSSGPDTSVVSSEGEKDNSVERPTTNDEMDKEAQEVYDYWVEKTGRDPKRTKFTPGRRTKVRARLREGYTVARIRTAIDKVAASRFHVEGGHTDLTMICRSPEKLDYYESLRPKDRRTFADERRTDPENAPW